MAGLRELHVARGLRFLPAMVANLKIDPPAAVIPLLPPIGLSNTSSFKRDDVHDDIPRIRAVSLDRFPAAV